MSLTEYRLEKDGNFKISSYSNAPAFSSFLPGIAGKYGTPLWCFYVNRGQCITSFGIESKDHAILEFLPANQAYAYTWERGFRTFIKTGSGFHEPFSCTREDNRHEMHISPDFLVIDETDSISGLQTNISYCTLPEEPFAALIRKVKFTNISSKSVSVEIADGLPQVVPFGLKNRTLKEMSRTVEAWIDTDIESDISRSRLRVDPADVAETVFIKGAVFNFSVSFKSGRTEFLRQISDPAVLFGDDCGFRRPRKFTNDTFHYPEKQVLTGKMPSAFSYLETALQPGESYEFYTFTGSVENDDILDAFVKKISPDYIKDKISRNSEITRSITAKAYCASGSEIFSNYIQQNYLDNILRGGMAENFGDSIYYIYSRKHGDIERDYNEFNLLPAYLSSGNSNFRDVNQNRRCDVYFEPKIGRRNIYTFYNLLRADGYNPLIVKPGLFLFENENSMTSAFRDVLSGGITSELKKLCLKEFSMDELVRTLSDSSITTDAFDGIISSVLKHAVHIDRADFGEGFWIDHWTYNLDLVESYLSVFPDEMKDLFFEEAYTFYDDAHMVNPRAARYYIKNDRVYQGNFLFNNKNKLTELNARDRLKNTLRFRNTDETVRTSLASKMLMLVCCKFSAIDPSGAGIEMEGGRPGWCDALNGLPALLGSSSAELFELKRMCMFMSRNLESFKTESITVPVELHDFYKSLADALLTDMTSFDRWMLVNELKEKYRVSVFNGFTKDIRKISVSDIISFCDSVVKSINLNSMYCGAEDRIPSYFTHEVTDYHLKDGIVVPVEFKRREIPLFLEGYVRAFKTMEPETVHRIHKYVLGSGLYDSTLDMFKINESLAAESYEIGRTRVFRPGWLENESIWLHMEYKYLMELLNAGCYDDFYKALHSCFVCFLDPEMYGRSVLENSSFIVSSAYVNTKEHGRGFVARLTGSTVEALNIFLVMCCGKNPFTMTENGLVLEFKPLLKSDLFTKREFGNTLSPDESKTAIPDNAFVFRFLGSTLVTYHNPERKHTYDEGVKAKSVSIRYVDGTESMFSGPAISAPDSVKVRDGKAQTIDVYY